MANEVWQHDKGVTDGSRRAKPGQEKGMTMGTHQAGARKWDEGTEQWEYWNRPLFDGREGKHKQFLQHNKRSDKQLVE